MQALVFAVFGFMAAFGSGKMVQANYVANVLRPPYEGLFWQMNRASSAKQKEVFALLKENNNMVLRK